MRKIIIALVLVTLLSIAFVTPALADRGGEPNGQAWFGQAHRNASQSGGPGVIGDFYSNNHQGNQGMGHPWEPGDGGARGWAEVPVPDEPIPDEPIPPD